MPSCLLCLTTSVYPALMQKKTNIYCKNGVVDMNIHINIHILTQMWNPCQQCPHKLVFNLICNV